MSGCSIFDPAPVLALPRVPLYPYTVITLDDGPGFMIPPMNVFVLPFWLCPNTRLDVVTVHDSSTAQDFSMRFWLAKTVLGSPDLHLPECVRTWKPSRMIPKVIAVYDAAMTAPDTPFLKAPLSSGPYILHAQNLTNFVNRFSLRLVQAGVEGA